MHVLVLVWRIWHLTAFLGLWNSAEFQDFGRNWNEAWQCSQRKIVAYKDDNNFEAHKR